MSNNNEVEDMTNDLRADDLAASAEQGPTQTRENMRPVVNPLLKSSRQDTPPALNSKILNAFTPEQQEVLGSLFERVAAAPKKQSVKEALDFSKLTMDDVYDLDIPIEAKAFMSADCFKIELKDSNHEPRWVNKNPQRLGEMIAKGFTYVVDNDLLKPMESTQAKDAEGHYSYNDVVAMKIDKATYYRALRAAHLRAMSVSSELHKRHVKQANSFMSESSASNDYATAVKQSKMTFYDPGIGV